MNSYFCKSAISDELRHASPEDLHKAAEAVVDAAICCRQVRGKGAISEKARRLLIEAVFRDPELTVHLFDSSPISFES